MKNLLALGVALLVCFAVAGLGGWWTMGGLREWYPTLVKPSWNPPNWVFGPVWTALYAMMAVASWMIWKRRDHPGALMALGVFGVQLFLNLAWSGLFFGLRNPGWAFADILALWVAIATVIVLAWPVDRAASLLLIPYLGWVTFATALNFSIWQINA